MERIRVAGIILFNDMFMLMHRIKEINGEVYDYYAIPGGGLEEEETLEQGVIREVKEELGVDVKVGRLFHEMQRDGQKEYFYLCEYIDGEFGTGIGPEFNDNEEYKDAGKFLPELVRKESIKDITIFPEEIKEKIINDYIDW